MQWNWQLCISLITVSNVRERTHSYCFIELKDWYPWISSMIHRKAVLLSSLDGKNNVELQTESTYPRVIVRPIRIPAIAQTTDVYFPKERRMQRILWPISEVKPPSLIRSRAVILCNENVKITWNIGKLSLLCEEPNAARIARCIHWAQSFVLCC